MKRKAAGYNRSNHVLLGERIMTVELLPTDAEYVASEVSSGRYSSSSDFIRETIAAY
jgi:hypothetical protein